MYGQCCGGVVRRLHMELVELEYSSDSEQIEDTLKWPCTIFVVLFITIQRISDVVTGQQDRLELNPMHDLTR